MREGKVGPGLNDNYWTYPKNKTDKGLFETIFGGAQGMMGPHNDLQLNETLLVMAWIRHLYTGPVERREVADQGAEGELTRLTSCPRAATTERSIRPKLRRTTSVVRWRSDEISLPEGREQRRRIYRRS